MNSHPFHVTALPNSSQTETLLAADTYFGFSLS